MLDHLSSNQQALVDYLSLTDYSISGGSQLNFNCPFCNDHRKKMYVSPSGKFICFLCETKGNSIISFVAQLNQTTYKEASHELGEYHLEHAKSIQQASQSLLGGLLKIKELYQVDEQPMEMIPLPTNCYPLREHNSITEPYFQYLYSRGLTDQEIKDYRIYYVVSGQVTTKKKTFTIRHQVVFITYDHQQPIYWNTRSIDPNPYVKSFNGVATKDNQHTKKNTVFNLDR